MAKRKKPVAANSRAESGPRKPVRKKSPPSQRSTHAPRLAKESDTGGLVVVGLGASAGGLKALIKFFEAMPADTGMVFVLIQHLDPTHESLSAELIGRHTTMQVVEVRDAMRIQANRVYVIPPNRSLAIRDGTLQLSPPLERRGLRVPIDFFLRSLAQDQQERAIGIILSGTGSDGTLGVREIKAAGGIVLVQAPETCQFDGMPRSAIATGLVDYVLPVEKMPEALIEYLRQGFISSHGAAATEVTVSPDHQSAIVAHLRDRVKYDFSCYKKGTLLRRIQRRMGLNRVHDMSEYAELLHKNKDEVDALYQDLLISVTNFFREPETWKTLTKLVIAPLVRDCDPRAPIRAWVPGCGTGEEAYSLVMVLLEELRAAGKNCEVNVFASDIDAQALRKARAAVYPENIAADISPKRLRTFFVLGDHSFRVSKEVRDSVVFAQQNVISDPPFSKLDLISCRNLLIYLESSVQEKIHSLFHFALRPGGYLILGGSETISDHDDLFQPISRKCRIYRRVGETRHEDVELPARVADRRRAAAETTGKPGEPHARRLTALTQQILLHRYAPACALVNQKAEALFLNGPIDRYLQLPEGEPGSDLMAMARDGVRGKLRSAVHKALRDDKPVEVGGARLKIREKYCSVRIAVEPLKHPPEAVGLLLVTFEQERTGEGGTEAPAAEAGKRETAATDSDYEQVIRKLEEDLRATRGDLQSSIEELETSNEELKASNEEATSVNEELQSANEELETSKEELQSLNEELQTVNNQLELKVHEIESANNDLANLLASTDMPTLFLDRDFRIKRFTPATTRLLSVIATDVGRPFSDFARNFTDDDLLGDCETVLKQLVPIEKEILDNADRLYLRRIVPYRTEDNRIAGVVITFTDITTRRTHAHALEALNAELEQRVADRTAELEQQSLALADKQRLLDAMLESTTEAIVIIDREHHYPVFNSAARELFAFDPRRKPALRWPHLGGEFLTPEQQPFPDETHPLVRAMRGEQVSNAEALLRNSKHRDGAYISINAGPLRNQMGEVIGAVAIAHDVTDQRRAEQDRARLAAIMQNASASIWIVSLEGTVLDWNRGAERLLGYAAEEIVGKKVSKILPPDRTDDFQRVQRLLLDSRGAQEYETVRRHRDGSRVEVAITESLVDSGGAIVGVCAVAHDIRERRRVEHQIAERAEKERQRIGAELHDTLGQEITAIGMIVSAIREQLGENCPQDEALDKLEVLVSQSKTQLRSMAKGLLPVAVDASSLRVALGDLAKEISAQSGIACRLECPDSIGTTDSFVATQLYLIAREAAHNAARHAKAQRIVIRLDEGEGLRLSVQDDGIGIGGARKSTDGMGVEVMRHRSSLIGATLRLESSPENGTLVTCSVWNSQK